MAASLASGVAGGAMFRDYELTATLGGNADFALHRARRTRTAAPVLIKLPRATPPRSADVVSLRRECALTLELPGAATLLPRIVELESGHALVMEDPGGELLSSHRGAGPLCVATALAVAEQLAAALQAIHQRGFVHRGMRPETVLFDAGKAAAWFIDLGDARAESAHGRGRGARARPCAAGLRGARADRPRRPCRRRAQRPVRVGRAAVRAALRRTTLRRRQRPRTDPPPHRRHAGRALPARPGHAAAAVGHRHAAAGQGAGRALPDRPRAWPTICAIARANGPSGAHRRLRARPARRQRPVDRCRRSCMAARPRPPGCRPRSSVAATAAAARPRCYWSRATPASARPR